MRPFLAALVMLCAAACIVPAPTAEGTPAAAPRRQPLPPAPPFQVKNGANLGGKIEIVSATVAPGRVMPGEAVKISMELKVLEDLSLDYLVFVHVEDVEGRVDRLNADHPPLGGARTTSTWKKGEVLRDEFQIYVPPTMPVRGLSVLVGFWDPKTDQRLILANPDAVRNDGQNRILLAQVPVATAQ
jgi:hypothetical protein